MNARILGLGEWLPTTVRTNDAWPRSFVDAQVARAQAEFGSVRPKSNGDATDELVARYAMKEADDPFLGARKRRVADASMKAHEAETMAARAALEDAGVDPRDIGAVLSSTAVPDRITPPTAPAVAHELGAYHAFGVGLDAVCASAVVGLELATALVETGRVRNVLLTQSHLMTRAFPMTHPTSPNVGDAATAIVVGASERGATVRALCARSNGAYFDAVVWRRQKEADTPWWEPGGTISMGSYDSEKARRLMQDTVRIGAHALLEVADVARLKASDIDVLASVQPRQWIPYAMAEAAGASRDVVSETFAHYAHLGACGVVVNLLAARRQGKLVPGARVALYGQGAGFTRAAAILDWG